MAGSGTPLKAQMREEVRHDTWAATPPKYRKGCFLDISGSVSLIDPSLLCSLPPHNTALVL